MNPKPEIQLILSCARTQVNDATKREIKQLLEQNLDWDYVLETAAYHGVLPLLYQNINSITSESIPPNILKKLRYEFHSNALHNHLLHQELVRVIQFLEKHKIKAIPFKGSVLAAAVYGKLTLREFSDLDLLVSPQDFAKAKQLLESGGGYHSTFDWCFFSPDVEAKHLRTCGEYSLTHNDSEVFIDLHQQLTPTSFLAFAVDFEDLQQRLKPVSIGESTCYSFGEEDLLLYLCVHGSKEGWRCLKWVCDLAQSLTVNSHIDWLQLQQRAQNLGCERMLNLGLILTAQLLNQPLPAAMELAIETDTTSQKLANKITKEIFRTPQQLTSSLDWQKFYLHLRILSSFQHRTYYCFHYLHRWLTEPWKKLLQPTANDRKWLSLPSSYYFLYYFLRPVRLLQQLGQKNAF